MQAQSAAAACARDVLETLGISGAPLCPLAIAATESPQLVAIGDDFEDAFDGQLEYHSDQDRFLLFYNTKYDDGAPPGVHHPRTRFSIAHELGHYFLEHHHSYLRSGGRSHGSRSEFLANELVEREADSFAAALLMPEALMAPRVNSGELSPALLRELSDTFGTSLISTAIRAVRLSHFPCALIGIRGGALGWQFQSDCLVEYGCYPRPRSSPIPESAIRQWGLFSSQAEVKPAIDTPLTSWFRTYDDRRTEVEATEYYLPVGSMDTLVVLLVMDEADFLELDED